MGHQAVCFFVAPGKDRSKEAQVPIVRESLRTYARASRRQSSTPDIPRPARTVPQEWKDACTSESFWTPPA